MQKIITILVLFVVLFQAINTDCQGQDINIRFEHLTVDDGLSQSTIICILQDKEGYIWFGTQGGLNKYDGYGFEILKHDPQDVNSLSANHIYSICEDNSNNLWIATRQGLNKYNKISGNITRYKNRQDDPESLKSDIVYAVHMDKNGFIWVKTADALNKLDTASGKFKRYDHEIDFFSEYPVVSDFSFPLIEDRDGNLWTGTAYGLFKFSVEYEQFHRFEASETPGGLSNNYVSALLEDKEGYIWIGTKKGINKYDNTNNKFTRFVHNDKDLESICSDNVLSLFEDAKKNLWVGTSSGLNMLTMERKNFVVFQSVANHVDGLSDNEIVSIYQDKSNVIWIGTGTNGIDKMDTKSKKFQLHTKTQGHNPETFLVIASVYKDVDSILWIGTWFNGLVMWNRHTGFAKRISTETTGDKIVGDNVHALEKDSNGKLWIGTKSGISVYDPVTKKFDDYRNVYSFDYYPSFNGLRIFCIYQDSRKNIWVGTAGGLHMFNLKNMTSKSFYSTEDGNHKGLSDKQVVCVMEDSEGYIWIGTMNGGLNRYNPVSGKFHHFMAGEASGKFLSDNIVYEVIEDESGYLWVGTSSGLNRFNKKDTSFVYYTKKNGLANDNIYEIIEDEKGIIWLSTLGGIIRFNKETEEIRSYNKDDGLQGVEFNNGASFMAADGEIFFGGILGLNSFYPDSMLDNKNIPPVVFTSFEKTNNEGTQKINIQGLDVIELSYEDFLFTIKFASLEFTKPEKNQYKYKMEGLNDEWIYIGTEHSRTFSNIPAGEYTFRVLGSNNDLLWNEKGISIKIKISPPWWKSRWAYLIYFLTSAFLVYYFIELRTRKLKKSNQILREKQLAALEIAKQKEELSIKNKNIMDSINYAKRIQQAMMPSVYMFKKLFPQSFILYKPKDIVSGDFYWIAERNNKIFVAAVDCTGHGVPGAFMSIIGYDQLRNIIERGFEDPSQILIQLNLGVSDIFSKNLEDHTVKDGMDLALCVIDKVERTIEFSGAFNPMYLARDNKVVEVKGNRFSVGMAEKDDDQTFEGHVIPYKHDDIIYIFSDGYPDQFGGPLGKKFKYRRFRHLLLTIHKMPIEEQKGFLEENIDSWRGELEQVDDILVIGIKMQIK